jgi:hypothetical protein
MHAAAYHGNIPEISWNVFRARSVAHGLFPIDDLLLSSLNSVKPGPFLNMFCLYMDR